MIRRRALLGAAVLFMASGTLAFADEVSGIVRWLRRLGFDEIRTSQSLLGRVQIRATGAIGTRELVINPRTGEILRDVWVDAQGKRVRGAAYPGSDDGADGDHSGSNDRGGDGGDDNSGHGGGDDDGSDDHGGDDNSDDGDSEDDDGGDSDNSGSGSDGSGKDGSDD